jgi:hypothetical protein
MPPHGPQLTRGKGGQRAGIRHDRDRLVEGADQILAAGVVDPGLAAHGRVHLGEQSRRHLHEGHTPLVSGRCKSGHVTHDTAAQGHDGAIPSEPVGYQHIENARDVGEGLVRLTIGNDGRHDPAGLEAGLEHTEIERRNDGIADDQKITCRQMLVEE